MLPVTPPPALLHRYGSMRCLLPPPEITLCDPNSSSTQAAALRSGWLSRAGARGCILTANTHVAPL